MFCRDSGCKVANPADPALLAKLPRSFVPALNEQFQTWDLLFPAERREIQWQMEWLARLPDADFKALFQPIFALEQKMDLPDWKLDTERMSVRDTGILVRSPYYPQWRAEVEKIFERIGAAREAEGGQRQGRRLVVCTMPGGAPVPSGPIWQSLEPQGHWLLLQSPFAAVLPTLFRAVAERQGQPGLEPVERTWVFEYDEKLSGMRVDGAVTGLCFDDLGPVRREFLMRLNSIDRNLKTVDRAYDGLRQIDLGPMMKRRYEPDVREFVRNLFLSGNGAMLFGNSFVQWGASEAFRRAAPQATFCRFGVRPKLKPFSSVVLFEDQHRANPVPDRPDPEGSFIDAQMLVEYVYLSAMREPAFTGRSLFVVALPDDNCALAIGSPEFLAPLTKGSAPISASRLTSAITEWLAA
jgi:hypothetical protein